MTPLPVAAVVFDLDGTLIDSESIYRSALVQALDQLGLAADQAFVHGLAGQSGPVVTARILARFGADFPIGAFRRVYATRRDALIGEGIPAYFPARLLEAILADVPDLPVLNCPSSQV